MSEYETEEQQVEALKKWWKENSTSLIFGLLIGVTGLFGWRYYIDHKHTHSVQGSDLYMQVIRATSLGAVDASALDIHNTLVNEFSDTPYASLASLALAKSEYEKNNIEAATAQLELAVKHASDEEIMQIANLRLASIYIEQKKFDEASAALDVPHQAAFDAQYEELRGDLYVAMGDKAQARIAYDKAIDLQGLSASKWLRLKRQSLGETDAVESPEMSGLNDVIKASASAVS